MSEITEAIMKSHKRAKREIKVLFVLAMILFLMPLYYEYSLAFIHVGYLLHYSLASIYILLIFLSGMCFGDALIYRRFIGNQKKELLN